MLTATKKKSAWRSPGASGWGWAPGREAGRTRKTEPTCPKAASQAVPAWPLFPALGSGALGSDPIPARLQTSRGLPASPLSQTFTSAHAPPHTPQPESGKRQYLTSLASNWLWELDSASCRMAPLNLTFQSKLRIQRECSMRSIANICYFQSVVPRTYNTSVP